MSVPQAPRRPFRQGGSVRRRAPHQHPDPHHLTHANLPAQDKYLRSVADFRNLQERTRRDVESARQFAIQRFAADLIESVDNLDRALESVPAESLNPDAPAPSAADATTSATDANTAMASPDVDSPNKD